MIRILIILRNNDINIKYKEILIYIYKEVWTLMYLVTMATVG